MFSATFDGCTGLTSIPESLFSRVTSVSDYTFWQTFNGCSGLTGYVPSTLFSGLIANGSPYAGSGNTGAMYHIFAGTGLSTTCPTGMIKYVTGYESYWNSKVSCEPGATCSSGYYLPANSTTCSSCLTGYTCAGGSYPLNPSSAQGIVINTINITFDGGSAQSCTYSGTFVPPTPTARPGYRFTGWKITCGIPGLDTSVGGNRYGYAYLNGATGYRESDYNLTAGTGQWAAEFSYGAVWGNANCNSTDGGTRGTVSDSLVIENGGKYCWCQATGFKAANGTSMYQYKSGPTCNVHSVSSFWVFTRNYVGASSSCESDCTYDCAAQARGNSGFRVALFGAVK